MKKEDLQDKTLLELQEIAKERIRGNARSERINLFIISFSFYVFLLFLFLAEWNWLAPFLCHLVRHLEHLSILCVEIQS